MNDSVRRCKETFMRSQAFGRENCGGAEPTSYVGRHLATIDSVLTGLDQYAATQAAARSAARQGTLVRAAARARLLRGFDAICRTARPMETDDPNLLQQFRVPHRESDQGVLAAAGAVAASARQYRDEFVLRGLSESFIQEFEADTEALRSAVARSIENRRAHVTATAVINQLIERGMKALRALDPYMRNTFASEPARLAAWMSASRIERRSARARAVAKPSAPPNSPTPDTSAPPPAG